MTMFSIKKIKQQIMNTSTQNTYTLNLNEKPSKSQIMKEECLKKRNRFTDLSNDK